MPESLNNTRIEKELVKLVKSYPSIWDAQDPDYKIRTHKRSSFESVALHLKQRLPDLCKGISADAVQSKWKNMRTYFHKQLKHKRCAVSTGKEYKSKWKHFNSMLFLVNTFDMMDTKDISSDAENETHCSSEVDIFNRDSESEEDSHDDNSSSQQHNQSNESILGTVQIVKIEDINRSDFRSSPCITESDMSSSTPSPKKVKRKKSQRPASYLEKEITTNKNSIEDIEEDYGKMIAKQMRLIPIRQREDVRLSIQKIIADAVRTANNSYS